MFFLQCCVHAITFKYKIQYNLLKKVPKDGKVIHFLKTNFLRSKFDEEIFVHNRLLLITCYHIWIYVMKIFVDRNHHHGSILNDRHE
jgi:hypothetical protein